MSKSGWYIFSAILAFCAGGAYEAGSLPWTVIFLLFSCYCFWKGDVK